MTEAKYNILLITTDQQHFRIMSSAGDNSVNTPNMDRLITNGITFNKAYTSNPVCVPARYSFVSGYMPHVFNGMEHNFKTEPKRIPIINDWITTPTLGYVFKNAGYKTALSGKLHVEDKYFYNKELEETFGFECIGGDAQEQTSKACEHYLNSEHEKPFLLWASLDSPHQICNYLKEDKEVNFEKNIELPKNFKETENETQWITKMKKGVLGSEDSFELGLNRIFAGKAKDWQAKDWLEYRKSYRHFMELTDNYVGEIINSLEKSKYKDNTVIVFLSDHGDHDGAHGMTMKRTFYEESCHVPFIIKMPDNYKAGTKDNHLVSSAIDLLPTLCQLANIEYDDKIHGKSLVPLICDEKLSWRDYIVCQTIGGRMVRTSKYKYNLYCLDNAEEELYDIEVDPFEMINLCGNPKYNKIKKEHKEILSKWVEENRDEKGIKYLKILSQQ